MLLLLLCLASTQRGIHDGKTAVADSTRSIVRFALASHRPTSDPFQIAALSLSAVAATSKSSFSLATFTRSDRAASHSLLPLFLYKYISIYLYIFIFFWLIVSGQLTAAFLFGDSPLFSASLTATALCYSAFDIRSVPLASDPSAGSLIDCVRFLVHLCTRLSPSSLTHSLHPCRRRHRSGHHPSLFIIHYTSHRHRHPTSPSSTSCGRRYVPVTALNFACSAHQQPSNKDRFAHLSRRDPLHFVAVSSLSRLVS